MNLESTRLNLITEASFENSENAKSQLVYVILMVDQFEWANIVDYGSFKSKRVARSVLEAEMHGLTLGLDYAYVINTLLAEILNRTVTREDLVDNKTLFNVVSKHASTTERRLHIDIIAIRESYAVCELSRIGWIPGTTNPADPLTKCLLSKTSTLFLPILTNRYKADLYDWAGARREI